MNRSRCEGLTLIELIIVLVIAGISLSAAAPNLSLLLSRNAASVEVNDFVGAVNLARSEALKRSGTVSIQAIDASDPNNEFGAGYCVVAGDPGDCTGTLIRRFDRLREDSVLNSVENADVIRFDGLGGLTGGAQNLDLCSPFVERRVRIAITGRARAFRPDDDTVARRPAC